MAKLVKCKTCGADIAKTAKTCPHCGAKQHTGVYVVCTIIIIITALACIGILFGDNSLEPSASRQPQKENEKVETIEISATDLWAAYDENEVNADNLYKNKTLSVTGTVFEIGKDVITDAPFILLKSGDPYGIYSIQCYVASSSEQEKLANVRDGDVVTITGKCTGKTLNVILTSCLLAE